MFFSHLLAIFVVAASANLSPRDTPGSVFLDDLKKMDADCEAFSNTCKNSSGDLNSIIAMDNSFKTWSNDCSSTRSDIQNSPTLSEADTQTIINYLNSTFEPCLKKSLTCLFSKRAAYQSSGLYTTQQNEVKNFKNCLDNLGSVLLSKSPSDKKSAVQAVFAKMDDDFNSNGGF